jgi:hypothetical protein
LLGLAGLLLLSVTEAATWLALAGSRWCDKAVAHFESPYVEIQAKAQLTRKTSKNSQKKISETQVVCTENLIRVADVMESPKLAE